MTVSRIYNLFQKWNVTSRSGHSDRARIKSSKDPNEPPSPESKLKLVPVTPSPHERRQNKYPLIKRPPPAPPSSPPSPDPFPNYHSNLSTTSIHPSSFLLLLPVLPSENRYSALRTRLVTQSPPPLASPSADRSTRLKARRAQMDRDPCAQERDDNWKTLGVRWSVSIFPLARSCFSHSSFFFFFF